MAWKAIARADRGTQFMRNQVWKIYLAVTMLATVAFLGTETDTVLQTTWRTAVAYAGVAAIVFGILRHRPPAPVVWWCFALGVFANATGAVVETFIGDVLHASTFPSVADAFYLFLYPAVALGLAMMIRRRNQTRDWGSLVDATTITTGLGLLAWVFLIRPVADDQSIGLIGHVVSIAYPVGDLVLLAMFVRLQLGVRDRTPAHHLITGSLLLLLGGDTAWAVINQMVWEPNDTVVHVLYMTFMVAYVLFGAAALHPSARELGQPDTAQAPRLSPALLTLLTAASLIAPGILALQVARHQITDGVAIVVGSVTLFLLVVTRMAQLLRQLEQQSKRVRELSRTDELTGLPNRRALTAELPRAMERARRDGIPLSVTMIDLDHFKRFNDSYGHPAGDRLLKAAAAAWTEQLRTVDHLARYGGEEFILLLPDAGLAHASEVVERLRAATPLGQTFSGGLAQWDGSETSDELIARADAALYQAKRGGRDRVLTAVAA
jgi:diguanylate cyclase (GGDEF)-like protein